MALGEAPNTGTVACANTAGAFSATDVFVSSLIVFSTSVFAIGNRDDITFPAFSSALATDGLYVPANTYFPIPAAFFNPTSGKLNLKDLYHVAGGTVYINLIYLR